jgi:peptidoglycan hydrolase-like protein with peptidoglycan-binding domain
MALQSILLRGDAQLEAAATSDPAHITPGQRGEHVRKIQAALNLLDKAGLDLDAIYGTKTANAVLGFKRKRSIINRNTQTTTDNIVGRMTMAALDKELSAFDASRPLRLRDVNGKPGGFQLPPTSLASSSRVLSVAFRSSVPQTALSFARHAPNTVGTVTCENTFLIAEAVCTNLNDPAFDPPKPMSKRATFLSDLKAPIPLKTGLDVTDGGRVPLTSEPSIMRLECLHPGDALMSASRIGQTRLLFIAVRQGNKGKVGGLPLTKLRPKTDLVPASKLFSDPAAQEGVDPENVFGGRPVNPKRGGRLINLGGEGETPEFEDYQVDLSHSFGQKGGFRPWTDDSDPSVFIPDKSASHITMRGVPLTLNENFAKVIKRIAAPGCLLTFSGDVPNEKIILPLLKGLPLERTLGNQNSIDIAGEVAA